MSERPRRHQRRPSQSVFINFDDLSAPVSDNVGVDKFESPQPSDQAQSSPQIRVPLAPSPEEAHPPAEAQGNVTKDDNKPTGIKN
ncbi:hypothetical protein OWV82_021577 [Melia azedarach]|uniref:Uncharacterized protein n=1 Tax=Melia azedarach TaxID=155640 RepID=A0ACC1WZT6_MELAZ|nr:hypothetical protein OWV82_021577 [Melia azedarach]